LAAIPAKDFDWYLRTAAKQEWEITTRLLLHYHQRRQSTAKNQQRIVGGRIDDLIEFAAAGTVSAASSSIRPGRSSARLCHMRRSSWMN
jgi:hypothetical protein